MRPIIRRLRSAEVVIRIALLARSYACRDTITISSLGRSIYCGSLPVAEVCARIGCCANVAIPANKATVTHTPNLVLSLILAPYSVVDAKLLWLKKRPHMDVRYLSSARQT